MGHPTAEVEYVYGNSTAEIRDSRLSLFFCGGILLSNEFICIIYDLLLFPNLI